MKKISNVFWYSIAVVFAVVVFGVFSPEGFEDVSYKIQAFLTSTFGWYYLILVTVIVVFCTFMIFSPIGIIRLG